VAVDQIKTLSEKWFGNINAANGAERIYPEEPEQIVMNEQVVKRPVPQNAIYMCWKMPERTDQGFYTTDLISDVLSNGNSSRMFQNLVKGKKLFSEINAFVTGDLDPGLFIVSGKMINGAGKQEAEDAIYGELNKLIEQPVSDQELDKVKNKIEANLVFSRLSVLSKAMQLAYYEMLGDANSWNEEMEKYRAVTKADIMDKSGELFQKKNQTTLYYSAINN